VLDFLDAELSPDIALPTQLAHGSKLRFALRAVQAGTSVSQFVYDACHLAQVHRLPCLRKKPYLTFLCGIELWEDGKPQYVRVTKRAGSIVAISRYTLRRAEASHGRFPQAQVCWLATESDSPAELATMKGPPEILIVGRLDEAYKGHDDVIRCWDRVTSVVPDAVLRIVGRGPRLPELRRLAGSLCSAARIHFEGFVPEFRLEELYSQATVFCMPSRGEGFGLVYIEAMRHGLPVVASIHDAAPEIVLDGQTGYLVDLDHKDDLPERLIGLLRDDDLARRLGRAGQQRWMEHFRYSAFRARFRPILQEFLAQR
jgi:phosphatidyl-myo-inositol dimannoside synthase